MVNEIRNNIMLDLQGEFSPQQLKIIDLAIAKAISLYLRKNSSTLSNVAKYVAITPTDTPNKNLYANCTVGLLRFKPIDKLFSFANLFNISPCVSVFQAQHSHPA